jgi:hypothetical protein
MLPHIIAVRGRIFIINITRITGYEHPMPLLSDRHQKKRSEEIRQGYFSMDDSIPRSDVFLSART